MSTKKANSEIMTVEEVDKLLIAYPKASFKSATSLAVVPKHLANKNTLQLSNIIMKICAIVSQARPVIKFARSILFFKPKWQAKLDEVMDIVNIACPPAE